MERSDVDEAVALLTRAQRGVLLTVPPEPPLDAVATALGLSLALEDLGKPTTVVSPSHVPPALQFLPGSSQVAPSLTPSPDLHLVIPLDDQRPRHVRWEVRAGHLHITVEPEKGLPFPDAEIRVTRQSYPWDLLATVGVPRLHALGDAFTAHTTFFYGTPILNLDRGTANEFFGTVNFIPANAGTLAEVAADLLQALGGTNLLTPPVATCLLAGLVAGTESFRSPRTTPRALELASALIAQEADHAAVVRHLFHTHTLPELRLLGRTLAHLRELRGPAGTVLVTDVRTPDFTETETTPDVLPAVFRELLAWAGEHRPVVLAFERSVGNLEALVALGRVSGDDREAFRGAVAGTRTGPFVLVNLGRGDTTSAPEKLQERVLPHLPSAA